MRQKDKIKILKTLLDDKDFGIGGRCYEKDILSKNICSHADLSVLSDKDHAYLYWDYDLDNALYYIVTNKGEDLIDKIDESIKYINIAWTGIVISIISILIALCALCLGK